MAGVELELVYRTTEFVTQNWEWVTALTGTLLIGYTAAQRAKIIERSKGPDGRIRCTATEANIDHYCDIAQKPPECDHLVPKRFARVHLKESDRQIDDCSRLAIECHNFHQNVRHPDMREARSAYAKGRKDGFPKVFSRRDKLASKGERYDYTAYNDDLQKVVDRQNAEMDKKHGGRKKWWPW